MGNIVDNVVLVNSGRAFDGPRINPNLLSHSLKDKLKIKMSTADLSALAKEPDIAVSVDLLVELLVDSLAGMMVGN